MPATTVPLPYADWTAVSVRVARSVSGTVPSTMRSPLEPVSTRASSSVAPTFTFTTNAMSPFR